MNFGKLTSVSACRYVADEDSSIPSTESSSIADSGYQSDESTYLAALREQRRRRSARMDKCRRVAMRNEAQKVALELMAAEQEVKGLETRIRDTQGSLFEARAQIKAYERPDEPLPPAATETSSCASVATATWSLCRARAAQQRVPFKCPLCMEPADCAVRVYFN